MFTANIYTSLAREMAVIHCDSKKDQDIVTIDAGMDKCEPGRKLKLGAHPPTPPIILRRRSEETYLPTTVGTKN